MGKLSKAFKSIVKPIEDTAKGIERLGSATIRNPLGTSLGEIVRYAGQLKGWMWANTNNILFKLINNPEISTLGKMGEFAGFAASTIGLAYLSLATKDIIDGKTPRDFKLSEVLAISGIGFIFGDVANTQVAGGKNAYMDKFTSSEAVLKFINGPVVHKASGAAQGLYQLSKGDRELRSIGQDIWQSTPNIALTKGLLNHIVVEPWLYTDKDRRRRKTRMKERGQEYLF